MSGIIVLHHKISTEHISNWHPRNTKCASFPTPGHNILYYHFINLCEKRLITKECIVTHTHLNFVFKQALHFSTLAITLLIEVQSCHCYCNTMSQSSFKHFAGRTTYPFLKLKRSILLPMYSMHNAFYWYING